MEHFHYIYQAYCGFVVFFMDLLMKNLRFLQKKDSRREGGGEK